MQQTFNSILEKFSLPTTSAVRTAHLLPIMRLLNTYCVCGSVCTSVLPFEAIHRFGHPENYIFSLSKQKKNWINVSKNPCCLILKTEALICTCHENRVRLRLW